MDKPQIHLTQKEIKKLGAVTLRGEAFVRALAHIESCEYCRNQVKPVSAERLKYEFEKELHRFDEIEKERKWTFLKWKQPSLTTMAAGFALLVICLCVGIYVFDRFKHKDETGKFAGQPDSLNERELIASNTQSSRINEKTQTGLSSATNENSTDSTIRTEPGSQSARSEKDNQSNNIRTVPELVVSSEKQSANKFNRNTKAYLIKQKRTASSVLINKSEIAARNKMSELTEPDPNSLGMLPQKRKMIISETRSTNKLPGRCQDEPSIETQLEDDAEQIKITWKKLPDAVKYKLFISDSRQILIEEFETENETSYVLKKQLAKDEIYKWKLVITRKDGKTIFSDSVSFTVGAKMKKVFPKSKGKGTVRCREVQKNK